MAAERLSVQTPPDLMERLESFREDYDINLSQAMRRSMDRGLAAYGYETANGDKHTRLQWAAREGAKACVTASATMVILALFQSFAFARFISPLLLLAAVLMTVVYLEPDLSIRLGWA